MNNGYDNLLKLLEEKNMKIKDLSTAVHIAPSTFSDWKTGKSVPKLDKLITLANYFDVDVEYIAGKSDVVKRKPTEEELMYLSQLGEQENEREIKAALETIQAALIHRPKLSERESRLLNSFSLLSDDMQNRYLDLIESNAKELQKKS